MKDYYKDFLNLKNKLESNSVLNVDRFDIEEGLSNANIIMIEEEFKISLPYGMKELYRSVSTVEFLWTLKDDCGITLQEGDDAGNINGKGYIPDLYTVFNGPDVDESNEAWKNIFWFPGSMDTQTIEENKKVRPVDFFDNNSGQCVCFLEDEPMHINEKLYLRTKEGKLLPMDVSLEEYIKLMIATSGFVNFQIAHRVKKSYESQKLKYYLPKIFPGISLKEFE